MKKYSFFLSAALVLFALVSCQKEVDVTTEKSKDNNKEQVGNIPFQLVANLPETKTTLNTDTWAVSWEDTDLIYAVTTDSAWGAGDKDSDADGDNVVEFSYDEGVFSTSTAIADGEHTFNFIYSGNAQKTYHRGAGSTNSLNGTQSFDANNPTAGLKNYDVLVGQKTVTTPASLATVAMSHLYALMKVTLHNGTGSDITVTKFQMNMPTGKYLAGTGTINFATPGITFTSGQRNNIVVNISNGTIAAGADLPVYFVFAPVASVSGKVTMTVTDSETNTYTKAATVSGLTFTAGTVNTAGFNIAPDPEKEFVRITSLSDLTTGDYAIIGEQTASSYGFLDYGSLNSSRIAYASAYSSYAALPSTVITTNNNRVWRLTVSGSGDSRSVTMFNSKNQDYLKANAGISWVASGSETTFTVTNEDDCFAFYGTDKNYYLGVNKGSNYWRDYQDATTFTRTNGIILYKYWEPTTLSSIAVSGTYPTEFNTGDTFSSTGLIVTATYANSKTRTVTPTTVTPPDMSTAGVKEVTVSYTEGGVTKSTTYNITISERPCFTVTLADTSEELTEASSGAGVVLPSRSTIGNYSFYGWSATNVSSETTTAPTLVTLTEGKYHPTANITLYPVYSKTAPATIWTRTEVSEITSSEDNGVYALLAGTKAFNGSISSGHGQTTTGTFSFDANGIAYSAPTGTCEVTLTHASDGYFSMSFVESENTKYLIAMAASSGNLSTQADAVSYWKYVNDEGNQNWCYVKPNPDGYTARLRNYNNATIRTYGANNGNILQMAKKSTTDVTTYYSNPSAS